MSQQKEEIEKWLDEREYSPIPDKIEGQVMSEVRTIADRSKWRINLTSVWIFASLLVIGSLVSYAVGTYLPASGFWWDLKVGVVSALGIFLLYQGVNFFTDLVERRVAKSR